ncbi:MAG TPA: protease pro-enzyme activation domain-containing protein, partial [Verrucomicrobiae bacterium]|nr:protease pro-enzyme activation domain-containing protein [Verrucomicrobiae bacterium]
MQIFAIILLIIYCVLNSKGADLQRLYNHRPAALKSLPPIGRVSSTNRLNLAIGLPLRNTGILSNLLQQIYDPNSANYHRYLTPVQFADRFGPTESDYKALMTFALSNHLQVTATHSNRVLLDVSGSAADMEHAFHVTLHTYRHPTEKRTFFAPDTEPSLALTVPVLHISGLDNYALPKPHLVIQPLINGQNASPNAGSGPTNTYMGNDFRAAYVPNTTLNGSGQTVGLLQFDGYTANDITYYENQAGLPNVPLQNILVDGANGNPSLTGGEVEVSLDIEMAISMAPGLSKIIIYMAPNPSPWVDLLGRMADDNQAKQLSSSWFAAGAGADPSADEIFLQMAAQGQSFFNASGDNDAYADLIDFPGDTPYITQVGGTTLTTSGPSGSWVSETVWNTGTGKGSGGGISTQYFIPNWQTNISMLANNGSTAMRNTPDVAFAADNIYVRANGGNYKVAGTSCAAPLWAGFMALANQQAAARGKPPVGFLNPILDIIGSGTNYATSFHDITIGNNESLGSPSQFLAVSGYDLCTGWGTPAGQNFINLFSSPEPLVISPATGFTSIGGGGGPFSVPFQTFILTNTGTNSLTWALVNTSVWLNASSSGGILTPGGPIASLTVSLNNTASNLVAGTYTATLWFTNMADTFRQSRQITLSIISPPSIIRQPTNQTVIEETAAQFSLQATGGLPLSYQWRENGTNLTDGTNVSGSTTTNLVINHVSAANAGIYTVIVTNLAGLVISSNASLSLLTSPPIIILQPTNQTVTAGATVPFAAAAIGSTPFSYQWQFNGANIANATNATLTLVNVQLTNSGNYSVTITNLYGATNSGAAVLTVIPPPSCDPDPAG